MSDMLPRLKPNPIPTLHLVPEYSATGRLAEVYAKTKAGLGVPWMGVVAMAFAQYPRFYERLWTALAPVVGSEAFADACRKLRDAAEAEAAGLAPSALSKDLLGLGYSAEELDEIRACNEVFSVGNMPYVLMATLARLLLEGQVWTGTGPIVATGTAQEAGPKPTLIEPHHAEAELTEIYRDIRTTLGLPFVNTDYRAFARWASYFKTAWFDLKPLIQSNSYVPSVTRVHQAAVSLSQDLPNVTGLTSDDLRAAASDDASLDEVLSVVRLFQWLLPGLAVNVACFRTQLM